MSNASDQMRRIPFERRPYGYLFVETRVARSKVYACEFQFRDNSGHSATFTCQVFDVDRSRHTYDISIFKDEGLQSPLIFAAIGYVDGMSNTVSPEFRFVEEDLRIFARLIINILHAILFDYIITDRAPYDANGEKAKIWKLLFCPVIARLVSECTRTDIPSFVRTLHGLYHL